MYTYWTTAPSTFIFAHQWAAKYTYVYVYMYMYVYTVDMQPPLAVGTSRINEQNSLTFNSTNYRWTYNRPQQLALRSTTAQPSAHGPSSREK